MTEDNNNILESIFKSKDGKAINEELIVIKNIHLFFESLLDENRTDKEKIKIIETFLNVIKESRYICEYFSSYNNESIYIFFFKLYLSKSSSEELKSCILNLFQELIINIEATKNIYEFLFQKFSSLYRETEEATPEALFNLLTLLKSILGDTDNMLKPRNYFSCSGNGRFEIDLSKEKIEIGTYLTFIINFKIQLSKEAQEHSDSLSTAKLIKIDFSNGQTYTIELLNQMLLKIKETNTTIKICPPNEWINLVLCIYNLNGKLDFYFFFNGENNFQSNIIKSSKVRSDDYIDSIIFFDNFYGEVSSMSMAITKESNNWSMSNNFLKWFSGYKAGLWKKKYCDNFFGMLKSFVPEDSKYTKSRTVYFKQIDLKNNDTFETKKNYADYLVFVFTPFNCSKLNDGEIESSLGKLKCNYSGNIRNHQYQCYQKKLVLVDGITNLIPLAELFLIRPKTLNEENLGLFLQIINNILNYGKFNIKEVKECSLFQILSLFIERYPKYLFTEKILENFENIGKTIFSNNDEALCTSYFEHIFLNEKILSKYSENLQIKFWQQVLLFCQSDKDQIETFMNMNRICLILRFYDKNKYTEMCCEYHLSQIKEEYIGNKTIMNPTMEKKLSNLEKLLNLVIESQDPANVISLFKLLTLDLSPCLTKFILNILANALQSPSKDENWKDKLMNEFVNNKYETIIINAFIHSLPDVRIDLLRLMYEIYNRFNKQKKLKNFNTLEKMLKTCLLPKRMFFANYKESKSYHDEIKRKKMEEDKKKLEEQKQKKNNLRMSSIVSYNYNRELNSLKNSINDVDKIDEENDVLKNIKEEEEKDTTTGDNNDNFYENIPEVKEEDKEKEKEKGETKEGEANNENKEETNDENNEETNEEKNKEKTNEENKEEINKEEANKEENNKEEDDIEGNLKINEEEEKIKEKEKENNNEDDLDLDGNLNINQQIEINSLKNEKNESKEKKLEEEEVEERKPERIKKSNTSSSRRQYYERFNSVIESDMNIEEQPEETSINTINTINKRIEKKEEKDKEEEEKIKSEEENEDNLQKEIVIKDELYEKYKDELFGKFLIWVLGVNIEIDINIMNLTGLPINNPNIFEIIFELDKEINDINLTIKLFESIEKLLKNNDKNCFILLSNKKFYTLFLDTVFKYYKKNEEKEKKLFEMGKDMLINMFLNSFAYVEKAHIDKYPCNELDSIFLWGEKISENNDCFKDAVEFTTDLLFNFMIQFKVNFENKMNFKATTEIDKNFYLKNYFIMLTYLFRFSFHFKNSSSDIDNINLKYKIMEKYVSSMYLDLNKNKISNIWMNFPFFDDIYKRLSFIWNKENIFKKYKLGNAKGNKVYRYEDILHKLILDKNNKNLFQNELSLLTYEEINKDSNTELIIPLIRTISISLMSIISILSQKENEEADLLYWLKEFKKFMRFIIISSTNLSRVNQLDKYNYMQEKSIGPIITSICFLKDILNTTKSSQKCRVKIRRILYSILAFCLIITRYQYKYIIKHKQGIKFFSITTKPARNDLKLCAIFLIFTEKIKDKAGNSLLPMNKLDDMSSNQYEDIIKLLDTDEWNDALFNNQSIKNMLLTKFFTFLNFKTTKDIRTNLIKEMNDDTDEKYTEEILDLLPLYEKELSKYSNSSLENTIQKKNKYKNIKKKAFSWRGLWSDRNLFFENVDKLKLKLINHYTKTFMKPILVPILDVEYYLPEFSGFKIENLFVEGKDGNNKGFKLTMDIDKILRLSELNQIAMNNIKESFGEKKNKVRENYLRKIYLKSNPELAESLKKITNNLDLGKEDEFTKLEHSSSSGSSESKNKKAAKKKYYLCCLVKASHHIKGVCFVENNHLNFKVFLNQRTGNSMSGVELAFTKQDDDYDQDRQTCFGSYFVCHPKDKDLYQITIDYNDIKWIFRRRYYYKNSAIEIFTTTNKAFYLNFKYEEERELVIDEFNKNITDLSKIYDDVKDPKDSFDNIIGFENTNVIRSKKKLKKLKLSKKIEMWKNWEINNFEMLMWLNIYGNRSYNDISQYPVFPWILSNYEDPLKTEKQDIQKKGLKKSNSFNQVDLDEDDEDMDDNKLEYRYRDMKLPMGMMELDEEGEKRKELFMETLETSKDPDSGMKPYIYGTNYSNPMYVCNFLTRLFPFTHISIELQGSKFDNPDRLFLSVKNSFYNSTTQKTDVRELIPEFFYLPEMFLNINELNLGELEDGTTVNDVLTPCDNNPYDFVMNMKIALESDRVSDTIQNWVDLIFGYKARGKEAELSNNLFTESSYQESIDIQNIENKEAMLRQVEFGLIPTQILNKECGKRMKKEDIIKGKEIMDSSNDLSTSKCKKHPENAGGKHSNKKEKEMVKNNENKEEGSILCVGIFSPEKISILFNNNVYLEKKVSCPVFDKVFVDENIKIMNFEKSYNKMPEFYSNNSTNNKAMTFFQHGKLIIMGGYYDGKVIFKSIENKDQFTVITPFKDESPILAVTCDKDDEFIFMGNQVGNVCIFKSCEGQIKIVNLLSDQNSPISHIYCSDELNLLATASIDGYICLYTLPLCKLVRCLKVPTENCSYVFLSDSPLPSIIVISDQENISEIFVYSINGKLYQKKEQYFKISNPLLVKGINSQDYLAFIGNDIIYIMSLPDLMVKVTNDKVNGVHSICFSEDNKILYALNKKGNEVTVIKEEKQKAFRTASFMKK